MDFNIDPFLVKLNASNIIEISKKTKEFRFSGQFVLNDIGVSSRVFNNWVQEGLMPSRNKDDKSTYKLSFTELIWFNIVNELRAYGFPLNKIRIVCKSLFGDINLTEVLKTLDEEQKIKIFEPMDDLNAESFEEKEKIIQSTKSELKHIQKRNKPVVFQLLDSLIQSFFVYRSDIKLLIDASGKLVIDFCDMNRSSVDAQIRETGFDGESFITISILKFLKKFISEKKHIEFIRLKHILNENEIYILTQIREGKANEVQVKLKNGEKYSYVINKKNIETFDKKISDLMLAQTYEEINVITNSGKIAVST